MNEIINHELPVIKTRIMFCTGRWLTGGMERKMTNLFRGLVKYYDIYLLTVGSEKSVIEIPQEIKKIVMSENEFNENYSDKALEQAKKHKIDVVIGVMNLFYGQLDLYEKCHQNRIKTIAANSEYFFYPHHDSHLYNVVSRRQEVFKLVDAVLWQTNFSTSVYNHINSNGYVMPNPNTFSRQIKLAKKNKKIIICVGRFNDYIKRIDRILTCFNKVLKQEPEAILWLVGPCDRELKIEKLGKKSIKDMMKEQKLNDSQIVFFGEINEVEKYYCQASVLLMTSESEGFCNVINEAACFGLPLVCNNIPGLEDIVIDGYNGLLSQQNDIDALANNVCRILSDNKLRETIGYQASKYVERFGIEEIVIKWRKVINTVKSCSSASDIKNKLNAEFSHKINDYYDFCVVLSSELNKALGTSSNNLNMIYKDIDANNKNVDIANGQLIDAKKKLDDATSNLEFITNQYLGVINSRTWKITSPLRDTNATIKKIVNHIKIMRKNS